MFDATHDGGQVRRAQYGTSGLGREVEPAGGGGRLREVQHDDAVVGGAEIHVGAAAPVEEAPAHTFVDADELLALLKPRAGRAAGALLEAVADGPRAGRVGASIGEGDGAALHGDVHAARVCSISKAIRKFRTLSEQSVKCL